MKKVKNIIAFFKMIHLWINWKIFLLLIIFDNIFENPRPKC